MRAGRRGVRLAEAVEDERQELRGDALARVGDAHDHVRVFAVDGDADAAARAGELDRVGQQVPDHLLQPVRVAPYRAGGGVDPALERHRLRERAGRDGVDGGLHDGADVDGPELEAQLAGDDARDVQQVVDELGLQLRVAVDHLQRALGGGGVERPALQHAHPAEHCRERCAQLVRERGEELVLGAVGVARLGVEPCVLEGEGGLLGETLREQHLLLPEQPAPAVAERQHADHALVRQQGDGEHGAVR